MKCTCRDTSEKSHVSLRASFFYLLSCFQADLAGQPSEKVLIHYYLFVGGHSVKDIAVGSKPAPLKCKYVDNPMKFCFKTYCNFCCCTNGSLKEMLIVVLLFYQCFLCSRVKRKCFCCGALVCDIQQEKQINLFKYTVDYS